MPNHENILSLVKKLVTQEVLAEGFWQRIQVERENIPLIAEAMDEAIASRTMYPAATPQNGMTIAQAGGDLERTTYRIANLAGIAHRLLKSPSGYIENQQRDIAFVLALIVQRAETRHSLSVNALKNNMFIKKETLMLVSYLPRDVLIGILEPDHAKHAAKVADAVNALYPRPKLMPPKPTQQSAHA